MRKEHGPGAAATASEAGVVEAGAATTSDSLDEADGQISLPLDSEVSDWPTEPVEDLPGKPAPEEVAPARRGIRPYTLEELLAAEFPPRETLLDPWLPEKGIAMIYAPRGVGKTHLALGCAYAVASGGTFLNWRAPRPRRVLLLDGEMPIVLLQERLDTVVAKAGAEVPKGFVRILAYDALDAEDGPDLSTEKGQSELEPIIGDADLIVVDSISTICRSGKENEAESWHAIQAWALRQRRKGKTVLFIHHSGKNGDQRGTSKREDVMDTVIKLSRPADYRAEDGARFIVEFTKNRGFMGPDAEAFEAALSDGEWSSSAFEDTRTRRILELHAEGLTQRSIAEKLGVGAATVNRTIKREAASHPRADPHLADAP